MARGERILRTSGKVDSSRAKPDIDAATLVGERSLIDNRFVFDLEAVTYSDELTSELTFQAASSPTELKRLFRRLAEICAPEQGWTKLFKVIARVAVAEWMEGELQVDFDGDESGGTTIAFYSVLGVGIRERLFSPQRLNVPIDEFQRAVVLTPEIVGPLRAHQGRSRLTLVMGLRVRNKDVPEFELEEKAKGDGERITEPPPALDGDYEEKVKKTFPPDGNE